jgi:hypothetical protein
MKLQHLLIPLVFLGAAGSALAQWQWMDHDGRKVFSDLPPPADIPQGSITRRPHVTLESEISGIPPAKAAASAAGASKASASLATLAPKGQDATLEARKKAADDEAAAKKAAEAEHQARARRENCQRAKQAQNTLDSGIRIAQVNAKGERIIMDDAARAVETRRNQAILQTDCN